MKSIKVLKNWYILLLLYFHLVKNQHVFLNLKNDLRIKLRSRSTDIHVFSNVWLTEEYKEKNFEIGYNDVIIDIGAHIGLFALYASQFCKKGKIFCYEPTKDNFNLLTENINTNKITNIIVFNEAVSSQHTERKIFLNQDQAAHSFYQKSQYFENVKTTTLKDIIDSNTIISCDLIKLDCEGAEYEILKSLPDEYFSIIKKIVMEYHIFNDTKDLEQLKKRLIDCKFELCDMRTSKNLGILFCKHKNITA